MTHHTRPISIWLFLIVFMVVGQCTIGAITRLTESGLSITRWEPVKGALPPLSEQDWAEEFAHYQQSPQYRQVNAGMALSEFKNIFWWEWAHRFWARLIGVVFALPLLFFWIKGWIPQGYKPKFLGLFALGGMQGAMGWVMVASGLVDNPAVSHYRLAAHLILALVIAVIALRWGLSLWGTATPPLSKGLRTHGIATFGLLFCTIIYGAFVAGLDAGLIYNEFPMMGAGLVPSEFWAMSPWWINLFENHASVQFVHRLLGVTTGVMALVFGLKGLRLYPHNKAFLLCAIMAFVQPLLGIGTLLMHVPVMMGALHQLGAIILLLALGGTLPRCQPGGPA